MNENDQDYTKGMRDAQYLAEKFNVEQAIQKNHQFTEKQARDIAMTRVGDIPTLRDQFAMAALPAILMHKHLQSAESINGLPVFDYASKRAYECADSMLAARGKEQK